MKKRAITFCTVVITLLLGSLAPAASNADSIWALAETVSAPGQSANSPSIAVDVSGHATAVWTNRTGDSSFIESSRSNSAGTWGTPVAISLAGRSSYDAKVSVDSNGLATAIWVGDTEPGGWANLQSSHSNNGGPWSDPVSVSNVVNVTSPKIAVDNHGRVVAIWHGYDGASYHVQSSSSLGGGPWSSPVTLGPIDKGTYWPQIAVDSSGTAVSVWLQESDNGLLVETSQSQNGGSWSNPVQISDVGFDAAFPTIATDTFGRKIAVWSSFVGGKNIIQSSSSLDAGGWTSPAVVSEVATDSYSPNLAVDSAGRAIVAWHQVGAGGHLQIGEASSFKGSIWSTPQMLSAPNFDSGDALVSVAGSGRAFVIWHSFDQSTSSCSIQLTDSQSGNSWAVAKQLGSCGDDIAQISLASTASGQVFAAWDSNAGGTNSIQAANLDEPVQINPPQPEPELASTGAYDSGLISMCLGLVAIALSFSLVRRRKASKN